MLFVTLTLQSIFPHTILHKHCFQFVLEQAQNVDGKRKKITFVNQISFFENSKELKKETFNQRGLIEIVTEG